MLRRTRTDHTIAASLLLLMALAVALLGSPMPAAADDTLDKLQARALERYLKDLGSRNAETRRDAADGLGGYEEAQAVAALAGALADEDAGVRQAAAGSLWETGEAAAAARPTLERALTDPEPGVRVRAAGALEAMDADPATLVEADADAVAAFLEAGMSATDAGTTGMPPLHHALMFACTYGVRPSSDAAHRIVADLLAHGADPNALDDTGNPALHRAAGPCDGAIITKLIAAGANVNAVNATGMSAFSLALALSDAEAAEAMLQAGFKFSSAEAAMAREWYLDDPVRRKLIERAGGG
jgi:hypothetical protein